MKFPALSGKPWPLRNLYPLTGLLLAVGLTAGLFVARATLGDGVLSSSYGFVSLAAMFVVLGRVLGRKEDALWETTRLDPLTAVGNRRSFEERLQRELCRAVESGMPLALLAIDLDHLKEVNDQHGHDAGDRALRNLGEVLLTTCRSRDLPARFGGDEFMVVMPRTTADEAAVLGERVRVLAADLGTSVSIGAADLTHAASPDAGALFDAADRALYIAKNTGRNRVVLAGDHVTEAPLALPARCTWDADEMTGACPASAASGERCAMDVNLRVSAARLDACAPPENGSGLGAMTGEPA